MPTRRRALAILALLTGAALGSVLLALAVGSIHIPVGDVFASLFGGESSLSGDVVTNLRLPRALAGFACGGLLALSGALLQVLLRQLRAIPLRLKQPVPLLERITAVR